MDRNRVVGCPACGASLADGTGVRRCDRCAGLWVPEVLVTEIVRRMTRAEVLALPFVSRHDGGGVRSCPECQRGLMAGLLEDIAVERCPKSHGYWFDAFELEAARWRVAQRNAS